MRFETNIQLRMKLTTCCLAIYWSLTSSLIAQRQTAPSKVETVTELVGQLSRSISQPRFSAATWGIKVVSLTSGTTLFEHNAGKLMKPASNAKLYTGALALDRLGPEYRIKTSLYSTARPDSTGILKGDLVIYGRGDPSFAARFNNGDYQKSLDPLVEALAHSGVQRIEGNLVGDETYFRGPPMGSSWTWDDLQYYYGAEVSALTVEDNVVDLAISPGMQIGDPCRIVASPMTSFLTFINQTKTAPKDSNRSIDLHRPIGTNDVNLFGHLPIGGSNHIDAVAVHRPAEWFVALFREALEKRGIKVMGNSRTVDWLSPTNETIDHRSLVELASVESRPMKEILAKMLKPSQNLYAQLLLLQVGTAAPSEQRTKGSSETVSAPAGARSSPPRGNKTLLTSEELGIAEMKKFLDEIGTREGEVLLEEGSGLSRSCLVTPNATVQLLRYMSRHKNAEIFRESLPIAAVDGTLRSRMKETKAARNVQAKTGRLRYVDTLSGYVTTARGEKLAFSIMLNNYSGAGNSGRDAVDALAVMLADFRGKAATPTKTDR